VGYFILSHPVHCDISKLKPSNSRLFCGTPDAARCGPRRALTDDILPGWRHIRYRRCATRWAGQKTKMMLIQSTSHTYNARSV